MVNLTFYPEPMKLAGIRMTKELIINNKKLFAKGWQKAFNGKLNA